MSCLVTMNIWTFCKIVIKYIYTEVHDQKSKVCYKFSWADGMYVSIN